MVIHRRIFGVLLVTLIYYIGDVSGFTSASFDNVATQACDEMFPSGHGVVAQTSVSPFVAEVPVTYTPGQSLTVTLKSNDGSQFKGFILQARRVENDEKVGEFEVASATKQNCLTKGGKTLSHTSASGKNNLAMTWTAPSTGVGKIKFVFTVVKQKDTFWVKETSSELSDSTDPVQPTPVPTPTPAPTPTPTPTPTTTTTPDPSGRPTPDALPFVDTTHCGISKSCFRHPADCAAGKCEALVLWESDGDDKVAFQIQGTVPSDESYIAIGLSADNKMGDDSVMECVYSGSSAASTGVFMSFNGVYVNNRLSNPTLGFESGSSKVYYKDGQLICQFKRYISLDMMPQSPDMTTATSGGAVAAAQTGMSQVFSLNAIYSLLMAKGDWSPARMDKDKHHITIQSPGKINFTSTHVINIGGTTGFPLIKAHGILMIIAWMVSASIAIMMPRYHKTSWPGQECAGKPIWFQIHRSLMVLTALLTITGFIIIFVSVGGYVEYPDFPSKVHPPLGIITTCLVIINPLMAACRPHPGTSKRPIFNVLHFLVGQGAHVCSVATIFIAMYMGKVGAPDWSIWVMVAYICWQTFIELTLVFHRCCTQKSPEEKYEMSPISSEPNLGAPENEGTKFKSFIVVIHAMGVVALALALIIPIASV